jgi:DNA mismatch endonuclease, patch repair protein
MEKILKKYLKNGCFENVASERSKTMSAIRGKNNKSTEVRLKMFLVKNKISGWRLHYPILPGKPDFYFPAKRVAIFVDGCYWHGCPICGHIPKTRSQFWEAKILRNKKRDLKTKRELRSQGVKVIRIWEHQLKSRRDLLATLTKIRKSI